MRVDVSKLQGWQSCGSDAEFQAWGRKLMARLGLDDGYCYSVSLTTGFVQRHGKMKKEVVKLSKSESAQK